MMKRRFVGGVTAIGFTAAVFGGVLAPAPGRSQDAVTSRFDPRDFRAPVGSNGWQPLTPGLQLVTRGFVNVGDRRLPHIRVYTVTDVTKKIDGVRAVVVLDQDIDGGQISEQALDFVAVDRKGNVWNVGSYTESYEGGQFVNALDGWLGGVRGASPGILVPAHPTVGTPPYYEGKVPGREAPIAQVFKTDQSTCVPFRCFKRVVVIQDGDEHKYFAPGVGGIRTEPLGSGGPQESENLINVRQLRPGALAAITAETLKLDKHARSTVADVFSRSAPAEQKR